MRALRGFALAAALLLVAGSANALIILTVREDVQDGDLSDIELAVDIELQAVSGGGLEGISFGILTNGVVSEIAGFDFGSGSGAHLYAGSTPDGSDNGWINLALGPTDGSFPGILTFSVTGATGEVTLGNVLAFNDLIEDISDTVAVEPYVVPEPATAALLGLGLGGLGLGRRLRQRRATPCGR